MSQSTMAAVDRVTNPSRPCEKPRGELTTTNSSSGYGP